MLILVDGQALIHRFFHAYPHLTRKSDGQHTGAVYGYTRYMLELVEKNPYATHLAVVFDGKGGSRARFAAHPEYKANRGEKDARVTSQYRLCDEATRALRIARIQEDGVEADDVIATYAAHAVKAGIHCRIVSGDKDFMQLMRPGVELFDHMKQRLFTEDDVLTKFGVPPHLVAHVQAFMGDPVDNIPGVRGVGARTAAALIRLCESTERALEAARDPGVVLPVTEAIRRRIVEDAHLVRLSFVLASLDQNVPVRWPLEKLGRNELHHDKLVEFLDEMEFASIKRKLMEKAVA